MPQAAARPAPWRDGEQKVHIGSVIGRRMTIDDRPRTPGGGGERSGMGERRRSTSRDLERYAGLFAARTKVMKSSAMRDLMAITERSPR